MRKHIIFPFVVILESCVTDTHVNLQVMPGVYETILSDYPYFYKDWISKDAVFLVSRIHLKSDRSFLEQVSVELKLADPPNTSIHEVTGIWRQNEDTIYFDRAKERDIGLNYTDTSWVDADFIMNSFFTIQKSNNSSFVGCYPKGQVCVYYKKIEP